MVNLYRSSLLSDVDDGKLRYLRAAGGGESGGSSGQSSREHSPKGASDNALVIMDILNVVNET